ERAARMGRADRQADLPLPARLAQPAGQRPALHARRLAASLIEPPPDPFSALPTVAPDRPARGGRPLQSAPCRSKQNNKKRPATQGRGPVYKNRLGPGSEPLAQRRRSSRPARTIRAAPAGSG